MLLSQGLFESVSSALIGRICLNKKEKKNQSFIWKRKKRGKRWISQRGDIVSFMAQVVSGFWRQSVVSALVNFNLCRTSVDLFSAVKDCYSSLPAPSSIHSAPWFLLRIGSQPGFLNVSSVPKALTQHDTRPRSERPLHLITLYCSVKYGQMVVIALIPDSLLGGKSATRC